LKTKRNLLVATVLAILLVSLAAPIVALHTLASEDDADDNDLEIVPEGNWYKLETDIVTVLFPRGGQKPMFIWWYTGKPDQIYVVKYQGLIEWFAFDHPLLPSKPEYYKRLREAWHETWRERFENMYFKPEEDRWMGMGDMGMLKLMILRQIMLQIMEEMETKWHRPFLPFDAGRWTLSDIGNITTPEGKIIGVSFAFTLVDLPYWMPNLQFAENNIMIKVRFYNETVEEKVPGTDFKYTVNAGEMKMDFVVNEWVWNIDTIKQLMLQLREAGFDIRIPEGKSRLALWVNLASINITKLALAEDEPEEIEEHSTASHMEIEDMHEDIRENKTETEEEKPVEILRPIIKLGFANETTTLGGFFRFVSSAKITNYPKEGDVNIVPVKASYISGGAHMRLFIGYPYFGNGTLEHDPSIGVDVPGVDTAPKYSVQAPSGSEVAPIVLGKYVLPLFRVELAAVLVGAVSIVAILIYAFKWKRKTPINVVGAN
jgi:hypothetical protein